MINKLQNIIKGRVVAVVAHGASINELEQHIEEFKDYDMCWTTLNYFTLIEDYILCKINKNLEIVHDCSTIALGRAASYEATRMPRIVSFLARPNNNLWTTSHGLIHHYLIPMGYDWLIKRFDQKILKLDDLKMNMMVGNSLTLLLGAVALGRAKRIILFGADGYIGPHEKNLESWYKPELQAEERLKAVGDPLGSDIIKDTYNFEQHFFKYYHSYCRITNITPPQIINCSRNSFYNIFEKTDYNGVHKWCK